MTLPAVAMRGVDLSLGRGAARVHILRDVGLTIAQRRGGRHCRRLRLGQIDAPDDHGRARAARQRRSRDRRRQARRNERGRAGAVSRRAHRHRVPVLSPHPDHDRARECRGAARARRRERRDRRAPGPNSSRWGSATALSHYPAQLSGGEQQRVALARALCPRPSLLIADEPTGNLDEATGRAIMDLMFDLPARRGATLALVTHDAALAARCDRVIRMRSGAAGGAAPLSRVGMNAAAAEFPRASGRPADGALRLARPARRTCGPTHLSPLHRARGRGDRRRRKSRAGARRRPGARGTRDPRRRRLVLAHPPPPRRPTSRLSSKATARCRRSRPCAQWPERASGDAALVEVKAVEPSWPRIGAAVFAPPIVAGEALCGKGRRIRRGGGRRAARPAQSEARRRHSPRPSEIRAPRPS